MGCLCGVFYTTQQKYLVLLTHMNFGELIKQLRIERQITLRQCCAGLGVDPSNWSKLERGLIPPPKHVGILERWAGFFDLGADQRQEFLDLAAIGRGELPADLAGDGRALAALAGYFQALRGSEPEPGKLNESAEDIAHSPTPGDDRRPSQGNRLRSQELRRMLTEPNTPTPS
jgi:transcriptional regulator with XRE-family HTH domain